jgi:hypothetical protein
MSDFQGEMANLFALLKRWGTDIRKLRRPYSGVVKPDHEAISAPQLNVIAIEQLLCPDHGIHIAIAYKGSIAPDVPVFSHDISAVLSHP